MSEPSPTTTFIPKMTSELIAMGVIETAMTTGLCNSERWRIARWVADRWQQPPPPKDDDA